jgi:mono/diheme cytochrome c family protein
MKHRILIAGLALVVLAVLLLLCPPLAASSGPPAGEQAKPAATDGPPKPLAIPESEKKKVNPVPNVPEAIAAGKATFVSQCAMCHGPAGDGKGDLAAGMKMKIPNFATAAWQSGRTDGEIFYMITAGHGDMPGEKRLPDQSKWEIVRFIRTLVPNQVTAGK